MPALALSSPAAWERKLSSDEDTLFFLQEALNQATDCILLTDALLDRPGPHILYVNAAFLQLTGYSAAEVLGQTPRLLQGPKSDPNLLRWLRHCLEEGIPFHGEGINYRKDGQPFDAEWRITPVRSRCGAVTHFLSVLRDVTSRKQYESQIGDQLLRIHDYSLKLEAQKAALEEANTRLQALATTDGLTGLRNHRCFHEDMEQEKRRAEREKGLLSLVLLDVDRFKQYNDTFGHPAGDEVLKSVAGVLTQHARMVDQVARYGGEEFAVLLPGTDRGGACQAAERLRTGVEAYAWPARPVTISLGIATLHPERRGESSLLEDADKALYHSKGAGRNCATHFDEIGPV